MITHHAECAEGENADIESFNALARRRVKAALQQKKLDLVDLNVYMTFGHAKHDADALWGQPLPVCVKSVRGGANGRASQVAAAGGPPKMKAGGGGMARKFISKFKSDFINPVTGEFDLGAANRAYNAEALVPNSPIIAELLDDARRATAAYRESFREFGGHGCAPMSAFGRVRQSMQKSTIAQRETRIVLEDIQTALRHNPVTESLDLARISDQQGAIVKVVRSHVDGGLPLVNVASKRVARMHACDVAKAKRSERSVAREQLCAPPAICDMEQLVVHTRPLTIRNPQMIYYAFK